MNIIEQLKNWNKILIPNGDYGRLEITNIFDCKGLAKYIQIIKKNSQSKILIFGERYRIPDGKKLCIENGKRISFNDDTNYYHDTIIKGELFPPSLNRSWSAHIVYCENEEIFDPIIGEPCQLKDFSNQLFGKEIPFEEYFN